MKSAKLTTDRHLTPSEELAAFRAALKIMDKWECDMQEKSRLLGIPASSIYRMAEPEKSARQKSLGVDLLERISYILNIHAALRILFSLPESLYGWVRHANTHPFFNGRQPIEVMKGGRVADLYEVSSRLNAIRGGWA